MKLRVLFIGHSDTRITPLCAAIMNCLCMNKGIDGLVFSTGGFWAKEGELAHPSLLTSAGEIGIDLADHRSHYVTMDDIESAMVIVPRDAMVTRGIYSVLGEGNTDKVFKPMDVYEPTGNSVQSFRKSREECVVYCEKLLKKLLVVKKEREEQPFVVECRPLAMTAAGSVERLEKACFSHPWTLANIQEEIAKESSIFLGAFYENRMVGYVSCNMVLETGYINNIGVHPDYRQMGIGETLMNQLEEVALERNVTILTLEVRSKNAPAISLYEKLGYKYQGVRPFFYRDPLDDANIMTKSLKETAGNDGVFLL